MGGIGNNLTVACPCGSLVAAPTLYRASCHCGRRFRAVATEGTLTHADVWERENADPNRATYRVSVEARLQPKAS